MPTTTDEKIVLTGASAAWMIALEDTATPMSNFDADPDVDTVAEKANRFLFDNLTDAKVKVPASAVAASGNDEYIIAARIDGAEIRYKKEKLTIEGKDETVVTDSASGTGSDSKNEISFTVQEADIDSDTYTAFLRKLYDLRGKKFLLCIPLGYNYKRRYPGSNPTTEGKNALGFAVMIGVLSSGFEHGIAANTATKVAFTFQSTTLTATEAEANAAIAAGGFNGFVWDPIEQKGWKESINSAPETTVKITPPALGATDGGELAKGNVVWL